MIQDSSTYREYGDISDEICTEQLYQRHTNYKSTSSDKVTNILDRINNDIIGQYQSFTTPFGVKPIVYADWTASGRALKSIEDYLLHHIIPFYGNTHTTTSITGHQSTCYRHEARQVIAESVNAKITGKAAEDVVLFIGNGTTAAVDKLIRIFELHIPIADDTAINTRPIVFVSSYEHHSNLLPWRESIADVVTISYHATTGVDLIDLEHQLQKYQHRNLKIGTFSACSNVTGICTDVCAVSILLHRYNALAFFDYATAAPYVKMDMNPNISGHSHGTLAYKDAIFFSGHKFLGGPGCPGVLIIKKKLLPQSNEIPSSSVGGGTVFYVTNNHHRYLSNREEREEGGTPSVLSDVKLGLVMHLKQSIQPQWIEDEEHRISEYVQLKLQAHEAIVLLGRGMIGVNDRTNMSAMNTSRVDGVEGSYRQESKHLPIFSFLIRCQDRFLHFHFVAALLNDLFGIQARGGCMCAGPFSQALLGITNDINNEIEKFLLEKHEVYRPGYTRLSFPYWLSVHEIDYIVNAILFVADYGHLFLSLYRYNHKTGEWAHNTRLTRFPERKWISNFNILHSNHIGDSTFSSGIDSNNHEDKEDVAQSTTDQISMSIIDSNSPLKSWGLSGLKDLFDMVNKNVHIELEKLKQQVLKAHHKRLPHNNRTEIFHSEENNTLEQLRWFMTSEDLHLDLIVQELVVLKGPIQPTLAAEDLVKLLSNTIKNTSDEEITPLTVTYPPPVTGTALSAYIIKRDQKLLSHTGSEERVPRYLKHHFEQPIVVKNQQTNTTNILPLVSNIVSKVEIQVQQQQQQEEISSSSNIQQQHTNNSLNHQQHHHSQSNPSKETANPSYENNTDNYNKILSGPGAFYAANPSIQQIKFHVPPKKIMKQVGQAIKEWNMIEDGDRLLLGLSGGKDSLALLHILLALQKRAPVSFTIACATVDPQTDSFDPSPLIPYVQSLGISYHYLSEPIVELAKSKLQGDSLCAFCSRFKRGLLYSCCRNYNYNKLVLAQHLDDLVESFLMSALHNGQIRTMKANYNIEAGDVNVIRPLIYVREKSTKEFSQSSGLPIINENCPACFEQPKERARMKKIMAQEETMIPNLYYNLKKALIPLMHDDTYIAMHKINNQIEIASTIQINKDQIIESIHRKRQLKDGTAIVIENDNKNNHHEGIDNMILSEDDSFKKLKTENNLEKSCKDSYCAPCYELA